MTETAKTYLPAAGHDWALPLYDPFVKLLGADAPRMALLDQAAIRPGHRVLDIGCGTGTLAIVIKRLHPDTQVVGLDPDPKALARARRKAARKDMAMRFDQGFSDELPYPDASFDRVLSTFMFHHVPPDHKLKTIREVRRVLAPGGSFHLLDFAHNDAPGSDWRSRLLRLSDHVRDNSEGRILALMREGGFARAQRVSVGAMLFGLLRVACFEGR